MSIEKAREKKLSIDWTLSPPGLLSLFVCFDFVCLFFGNIVLKMLELANLILTKSIQLNEDLHVALGP